MASDPSGSSDHGHSMALPLPFISLLFRRLVRPAPLMIASGKQLPTPEQTGTNWCHPLKFKIFSEIDRKCRRPSISACARIHITIQEYNVLSSHSRRSYGFTVISRLKRSSVFRLQIPRLSAQRKDAREGLTLPRIRLGLGRKEFSCGLTFVALSRVTSLN